MDTKTRILKYLATHGFSKTSELSRLLKISRQTTSAHLKKLVEQGKLTKTGSTKSASYSPVNSRNRRVLAKEVHLVKTLKGLHEDQVFESVSRRLNLNSELTKNVNSIVFYGFTEMLNNAIDHSRSAKARIDVVIENGQFTFTIQDLGIGIFANVQKIFSLENEFEAAELLSKGKQTTMPSRHSGEGIFFTSRIADQFTLESHELGITIDNLKQDTAFKTINYIKGTRVKFSIKKASKKNLQKLFSEFSNDDFEFDKNKVRVKLSAYRELVSRSEARRFLAGLEKFKKITLDFKGVQGIGQAFADEVFRVFKIHHPQIEIDFINASPAVNYMARRATEPTK